MKGKRRVVEEKERMKITMKRKEGEGINLLRLEEHNF